VAWTTKKSARAGEAPRGRENPFEGSIRRNGFGPGYSYTRIGVFSPQLARRSSWFSGSTCNVCWVGPD